MSHRANPRARLPGLGPFPASRQSTGLRGSQVARDIYWAIIICLAVVFALLCLVGFLTA